MPRFEERPYQTKAIADLRATAMDPVILYAPTGAGKTAVMCRVTSLAVAKGRSVMFMGDSTEIVEQTAATMEWWGIKFGIIQGQHRQRAPWELVHIGTIQTLRNRTLPRKDIVFVDECFPGNVIVDGRSIAEIAPGDFVCSFNHFTGNVERRVVLRTSIRKPSALCRIRLANGRQIVCTPKHPFYTGSRYTEASQLKPGDQLHEVIQLRDMRKEFSASDVERQHHISVLSRMPGGKAAGDPEDRGGAMQDLLDPGTAGGQDDQKYGPELRALFGCMQAGIEKARASQGRVENQRIHENDACRDDAGAESDEVGEGAREAEPDVKGYGVAATGQGWQRFIHGAAEASGRYVGASVDYGIASEDKGDEPWTLPKGRHREYGFETGDRGRRWQPRRTRSQRERSHQNRNLEPVGVAGIEILEPGSTGEFGGLCPDGFVYNLEVEGNSNYFADGVLVHNCHLARAASWEKVIQHYIDQGAKVIGASATPCRLDGRGLGKLFKQIVYCPSIEELTQAGHLVPFRIFAPPPPDLSKVHTSQGDFKKDELAQVMDKAKLIGNAVEHYGELGRGRLAILAATGIEHSKHLAAAFVAAGIPAAHCDGTTRPEERARILKSLPAGEIQVLCQVDICGKGYDCPPVSCVIDCRPTQSLARWLQFVGRGIRPYPGKVDCLLLDHSGNVHRPEFGLPDQPREWTLEETATKRKAEDDEAVVRIATCRQCFATFRPGPATCPHCGAPIVPEERKIIVEDGRLEEVKPRMVCSVCRREMPGADRGDPCAAELHGPENWGDFGEMVLRPKNADCRGVAQRAYAIAAVVRDPEVAALQMVAQEKGHPWGWLFVQVNILAKRRGRSQGWAMGMLKQMKGAGVQARA